MKSSLSSSIVLLSLLQLGVLVAGAASQSVQATNLTENCLPKRIDTHCHFVPPFYKELLDSRGIESGGRPIPSWSADAHLALNAEVGIVTSIISTSTPGAKLSKDAPIEEGRQLARQLNAYAYNVTMQYPKRFLFFATLTLPDLEGAVAEAIYSLDTLKAAEVVLLASSYGELLGTPRYAPLYEVLNERCATVFIHPSNSPCPEETIETVNSTDLPPFVIDFLLDTSRAAVNLVYRNVTKNYPNINFILAHSGGFLPLAATRAAGALSLLENSSTAVDHFYQELKKFYVDLALSATETALPSTTAFFNATQITFGSDFPFAPDQGILVNSDSIQSFHLLQSTRNRINFKNAFGLFKKFLI